MSSPITRRRLLTTAPAAGMALHAASTSGDKPALLGGPKVRTEPFPAWPRFDEREERGLLDVLRSGRWGRGQGQLVRRFEEAYAQLTGAREVLAVSNGTAALYVSLNAFGVEPGDEVIVPPYTFIATINVVLRQHALPVFVDSDPDTFQIDARKIDAAISPATRAVMPVHLGGNVCDLDAITAVTQKRKVTLIEDACQAHLAEWKGRKAGTFGDSGCFSFQASKNLNSGEGGAILFRDPEARERAYAFHNSGSGLKSMSANFTYASSGTNLRLTEFQAAILLAQMTRLEQQSRTRTENATYLTSLLKQISGIRPARMYEGCTANAYHLYMFRYDPAAFAGLPRERFLKALNAEGVPSSGGYSPLNTQAFLKNVLASRGYNRIYGEKRLKQWDEQNHCPVNDKLCSEGVWFTQTMLLGDRTSMDQIAEAIRKIQAHSAALAKA